MFRLLHSRYFVDVALEKSQTSSDLPKKRQTLSMSMKSPG